MSTAANTPADREPARKSSGRVVLGWLLVGIPLAYGVFQTLTQVAVLFR
ncbi:hypothetical protein AAHB33_09225 [Paenarthrobacter sp. S56]